jgi:membrane protein YdbS with pleckstrin-like domain
MDEPAGEPSWPAPAPAPRPSAVARLRTAAREWDDQVRSTAFVPASEAVVIDQRRHPVLLLGSVLRTLAGLYALAVGLRFGALLVFAVVTAVWAVARVRTGLRTTAYVAAGATAGLVVLTLVAGALLSVLALLLWIAEDVTDWYCDRLVVTDKRIYRRYGVLTGHSPSISLTAVAYLDAAVPPLGRLLHYGTLRLDSAAQNDAPLSRFDLVPDVVRVSHEILRLRSKALPRFPLQ